jgi:hypothetical protein
MPPSPFSEKCKPPKPPILASLSGGLSVKLKPFNRFFHADFSGTFVLIV